MARVLAKERPDTKIIACEPEDAQLLASGLEQARNPDGSPTAGHSAFKPHPMQGWTPDFIPKITGDAVAMGLSTPLFAGVPAEMTPEEMEISRSTPSAQFTA